MGFELGDAFQDLQESKAKDDAACPRQSDDEPFHDFLRLRPTMCARRLCRISVRGWHAMQKWRSPHPTTVLLPNRLAIHSNDNTPLRIVARLAYATQLRDNFQSDAESDSRADNRPPDESSQRHGERSAPNAVIAMNLFQR